MNTRPVTLLVVEDDAVDLTAVKRVLDQSSLCVSRIWSAATLAEALALLEENVPDVILLGLGLPDSDGLDSVSRMQERAPGAPIIILTEREDQDAAIAAVQRGVQDYLTKGCINTCSLSRAIRYAIERKDYERQLRAVEKRYRTIFENSAVVILMFDDQRRLVSWNRVTEDLLGMDREDLYHKRAETFCSKSEWARVGCEARPEGEVQRHLETKMARKSGEVIDVHVSRSILTESRNGVDGSVCVVQDITNRKRAERKMEEAIEEANRVNEELIEATARANDLAAQAEIASAAKSQFLANMTHDIRTPMNAIIGFSDILAELPLEPVHKEYIEIIRQSGRHLIGLLNDVLDLSKIDAGRLQIERVDCELSILLETVNSMTRVLAERKGLQFDVVPEPGLPNLIHTDPVRLRQCLTNLVSNAIKFTEAGYVRVRISPEGNPSDPYVRFDVEDSGAGIAEDKQESIFEPFAQLDADTAQRYGGTGLGLTITRSLAEMLGGSLRLKSRPGQGSVFSLCIPVRIEEGKRASGPGSSASQVREASNARSLDGTYQGRVLAAEDVQTNQRLVHLMLERLGLTVTIAENGGQAIEEATSGAFDLILMDVRMPGLNGLDATRQLRRQGISIPIVALTAHTMPQDRQECIDAGCNAYLAKPIDRARLIEVIERYLPRQCGQDADSSCASVTYTTRAEEYASFVTSSGVSASSDARDIIDWTQLISRIVDEELAEDIMPIAAQDNRERLELLAGAIDEGNADSVRLYAHAITGSMMNVGASRISRVARALEHQAAKGDLSRAKEHLAVIGEEFERFETLVSRPDWIDIVKRGRDRDLEATNQR